MPELQSHHLVPIELNLAKQNLDEALQRVLSAIDTLSKTKLPEGHPQSMMTLLTYRDQIGAMSKGMTTQRNTISRILLSNPK